MRNVNPLVHPRPSVYEGVVHLGAAKEIPPVLRELGTDPDELIHRAGIDPDLFNDRNNPISLVALGRLFTLCIVHTRCSHFGLLVGQRATIPSLGFIGGVMQHSPTVGDALRRYVLHLQCRDLGAAPTLSTLGDVVMLSFGVYQPGVVSSDRISDFMTATCMKVMQALCGPDWGPDEVLLPRHSPANPEPYRRLFQAPARFDQETAALVFPASWLEHRIAEADVAFREVFEERVQVIEAAADSACTDDVRRLLRSRLQDEPCSADAIAGVLAMRRRSLNRRLSSEGTGFRELRNEARFEIARQLLADNRVPLGQIAAALGYSEAGAFTRAFRRWTGRTPSAWRAGFSLGGVPTQ